MNRNYFSYKLAVAALLAAAWSSGRAETRGQRVSVHLDPGSSEVHWTLGDVTHTVKGTFKLKGGVLTYDSKTGAAEGELLVDVESGDSGSRMRDDKMKKEVLETQKYPQAFFHPTQISGVMKPGGPQELTALGTFNIHGQDHPMTLKLIVQVDGSNATATTHFVVPYVAWGMKDPSILMFRVAKQVDIDVNVRGTVDGLP